jgi:hypothetical protein
LLGSEKARSIAADVASAASAVQNSISRLKIASDAVAGFKAALEGEKDKLRLETEASVQGTFHVSSREVVKVRALAGDKSDGIPSVRTGMGPVTAAGLVRAGMDPAVEHWSELPEEARRAEPGLSASGKTPSGTIG